jgi:streptogramin lyase
MFRHARTVLAIAVISAAVTACEVAHLPPQPKPAEPSSRQTDLPFAGLQNPHDIAVNAAGDVYVTDLRNTKDNKLFPGFESVIIELPAGAGDQVVLPFTRSALASDIDGNIWVIDPAHEQLVRLAGTEQPSTVRPLPNLGLHSQIHTVDTDATVYGTAGGGVDSSGACCLPVHVVKSVAGAEAPTPLPFKDLNRVGGVAVDAARNVYVGDTEHNRALRLATGSDSPKALPFNRIARVVDVAVDNAGNVYVVDADLKQVMKLAAGSAAPTVLPFAGLDHPVAVAVDSKTNVYVVDAGSRRVVKLAAP